VGNFRSMMKLFLALATGPEGSEMARAVDAFVGIHVDRTFFVYGVIETVEDAGPPRPGELTVLIGEVAVLGGGFCAEKGGLCWRGYGDSGLSGWEGQESEEGESLHHGFTLLLLFRSKVGCVIRQ